MELAQRDGKYPNDIGNRLSLYSITVSTVNTSTGLLTVGIISDDDIKGKAIVFPTAAITPGGGGNRQIIPVPLENELYYIKFVPSTATAKIYKTLADWTAETNPIIFTVDQLRNKCELDQPGTVKAPCRVATTANISLSGLQTIDGVSLIEGDRVLVKNQTAGANNGIYDVSSGAWTRAIDYTYGRDTSLSADQSTNENQVLSGIIDPLTGIARVVGGRTLAAGRYVLLMNQDDATENDLWISSAGAWSRYRTIYPTGIDINRRLYIRNVVSSGPYRGQWFTINLDVPITIGTTPITIEKTKEPGAIFVDDTYTFILEGTVNKLKGFFMQTEGVKVGTSAMVYTTIDHEFFFDYAFKKYPQSHAGWSGYGSTGGSLYIPLETLGVADPEYIYGYPRYPRVTTPRGYPASRSYLGINPGSGIYEPMPLTLTIHMVAAYLVKSGAGIYGNPYIKVNLGDITETLTYSEAAGAWISDVVNYYEIPGRIIVYNPGQLWQQGYGSTLFIDSRFAIGYPSLEAIWTVPTGMAIRFSHQQAARKTMFKSSADLSTHSVPSIFYSNDYYVFADSASTNFISSLASPFSPALP